MRNGALEGTAHRPLLGTAVGIGNHYYSSGRLKNKQRPPKKQPRLLSAVFRVILSI